jgi:hypothetical protein
MSKALYTPIREDLGDPESKTLLDDSSSSSDIQELSYRKPSVFRRVMRSQVPWMISTLIFAFLSIALILRPPMAQNPLGSYEAGFATDYRKCSSIMDIR